MNKALEKYVPVTIALNLAEKPDGVSVETTSFPHAGATYTLVNVIGSSTIPEGKYLVNPASGNIEMQWIQGIGSDAAPAPQGRLMSVVINGILNRKLPWGLVLLGVFLVIAVELLGVRSLSFAVGSYLGIGTTAAIFCGGVVRWLAESGVEHKEGEEETSPGSLYASGLIAAGGIVGLMAIAVKYMETEGWIPANTLHVGGPLADSSIGGLLAFMLLGYSLYYFARKPLK